MLPGKGSVYPPGEEVTSLGGLSEGEISENEVDAVLAYWACWSTNEAFRLNTFFGRPSGLPSLDFGLVTPLGIGVVCMFKPKLREAAGKSVVDASFLKGGPPTGLPWGFLGVEQSTVFELASPASVRERLPLENIDE